jgi:HAD superfamily hydrolase (TIGR01548 family)
VNVIVFDVDGVLADVAESFREGIVQTVRHFTGQTVTRARIQEYKLAGGWNNDWALSRQLCADHGVSLDYAQVAEYFLSIYLGPGGLIEREQWLPQPGLFARLASRFRFAIFTGRSRVELAPTLEGHANGVTFDPIITADDVAHGKPAPDGLQAVQARFPGATLWYVGDTVDDARSARAAGVPFIGVAAHNTPASVFLNEGARAVIADINALEEVLPA